MSNTKQIEVETEWDVFRNKEHIGTVTDVSEEKAIEQVIDAYHYDNFGQAGALTEWEVSKANQFEDAKFTAKVSE